MAAACAKILPTETSAPARKAAIAVEAAACTGKKTWVALAAGPDANLMTPEEMRIASRTCVDAGASIVLVNCTPPDRSLLYLEAIEHGKKGVYANAGSISVDEYVQHARA